jgi:uncharacterized peroxidase-related enzyme
MLAHAEDLRVLTKNDALAEAVKDDYRTAPLEPRHMALCDWAAKLTSTPAECTREDVDGLREHGWTDEDVVFAAQIIGYFNHLNRLADGLGIDLEPEMQPEQTANTER